MTVKVTRPDGQLDEYMRYGDVYIKHHDGSLEVFRRGARLPYSYAAGAWSDVEGDENKWSKRGFRH